jgi:hypothetical protein
MREGRRSVRLDRRMSWAEEWHGLVDRIRELDGFHDFLRPPAAAALSQAAAGGPVVVLNASRYRCDAVLVRPGDVTSRHLPGLSLEEISERATAFLRVLQETEAAESEYQTARRRSHNLAGASGARLLRSATNTLIGAQETVHRVTRDLQEWMWDRIAAPVLQDLGVERPPAGATTSWPRLWWCPTGPLTLLPLHAAGYHADAARASDTVLDRCVSSYTSTLGALLRTGPARSEVPGPSGGGAGYPHRLLMVSLDQTPGLAPLDARRERDTLLALVPPDRRTVLEGPRATREAVRRALPDHGWVHFSGHADQDLLDPSRGGLALYDGLLTVAEVSSLRPVGSLAALSACKTASRTVTLMDEATTLAASLQYSGFRHVLATLWSVQDDAASRVFGDVYADAIVDGYLVPERIAGALHGAVRALRADFPDWPGVWVPFVHAGP